MASTSDALEKPYLPFRGVENDASFYSPLDLDSTTQYPQIRYVELQPGSGVDDIVCSLRHTTLFPELSDYLPYEALSYCWGSVDDLTWITLLTPDTNKNTGDDEYPITKTDADTKMPTRGRFRTQLQSGLSRLKGRLHLGGKSENSSNQFRVTRNLEAALRALRDPHTSRTLWIDAVCINQADAKEKTHQVQNMNLIYAYAKQVLVWLGNAGEDSTVVFRCRELLDHVIRVSTEQPYGPRNQARIKTWGYYQSDQWGRIGDAFYDAMAEDEEIQKVFRLKTRDRKASMSAAEMRLLFLNSFDQFIIRPWFQRVWVYQEVLLAKRDVFNDRLVTIVAGHAKMDWLDLMELSSAIEDLFRFVSRKDVPWFRGSPGRNLAGFRISWYYPMSESWSDSNGVMSAIFKNTAGFKASDPRDKLFALLHLARDTRTALHTDVRLLPNYEKPVMDVILDFWNAGIHLWLVIRLPGLNTTQVDDTPGTFDFALWYDDDDYSKESPDLYSICFIPGFDYPFRGTTIAYITQVPSREDIDANLFLVKPLVYTASNGRSLVSVVQFGLKLGDEVVMCQDSSTPFVMSPIPAAKDRRYMFRGACSFITEHDD